MNIAVLMHVPFEDEGAIAHWAAEGGHRIERFRLFEGRPLPGPEEFDMFVAMGGPMGAEDDQEHPYLPAERELLAQIARSGRPVLGICLGAQLLSLALGGQVTRNKQPEIGFFGVEMTDEGLAHEVFHGFPRSFEALHWHGDTFSIPDGAVHAASSIACAYQAFVHGERAVGLQFHLEAAPATLDRLLAHCADELVDAPFVQDRETLLANERHFNDMNRLLYGLLDRLAR
ncbi:MAG: type 1 glutamine amidotransferase [Desulfovibrionaceae bacterium]